MASLLYQCDNCFSMITLAVGELYALPFNRLPTLVLEADRHRCNERGNS